MPEERFKELLDLGRALCFDLLTADGIVCLGPCYLFHATLIAGSGGAATAVLYDGHNTGETKMVNLGAVTSHQDHRAYNPPVFYRRGIYVDVGTNVTGVELHYLPVKE